MPSADRKNILTILEKRLNQVSYEGFCENTLKDRREILTQISRVLLDPEKRQIYEEYYVNDSLGDSEKSWEVPQGSEVGGLIILLEAGQAEEAIRIGNIINSKWKSNIAINGTDYHDLMLLIDHASMEFAKQLSTKRFYESSAAVIKKRIRKIDNEQLGVMQERLKSALDKLKPYYILDLISRNSSEREHTQGIEELKELVKDRGGLEASSDRYMSNDEFKAFIRQIRGFLNVQEQVDLFRHWSLEGSATGSFLSGIALVAAGFAQRKPKKLVDALQLLNQIDTQDLETLKANIYLLLGDIEKADILLSQFGDDDLKAWCKEVGESKLAQQCEWCKEWLERDVLCGYRDLEVEPDLEAYFSDRDVITYIERNDSETEDIEYNGGLSVNEPSRIVGEENHWTGAENLRGTYRRISNIRKGLLCSKVFRKRNQAALFLTLFTILAALLYVFAKQTGKKSMKDEQSTARSIKESQESDVKKSLTSKRAKSIGIAASEEFLLGLLKDWFAIKQTTLAGNSMPITAKNIATDKAIERLVSERAQDKRTGETQKIVVNIKNLRILRRSEEEVEVELILNYHDQRLNKNGQVVESTPLHDFVRNYTVVHEKGRWLVD